jgi:superfamily II DNA or RNA helicase
VQSTPEDGKGLAMQIILPSLYDHQAAMRDSSRTELANHRRIVLCAPPGCGKTRIAKVILGASANRESLPNQSGNILFTVHRRGLVDNASNSFDEEPRLPHGKIMSGKKSAYGHRVQVASIDTLLSWFIENGRYETNVSFDMIVFDECHSHHSKLMKFLKYHDEYRAEHGLHPAYVIGLSATPQAKGLADLYKTIVQGPSTQWLNDNGYLSPFRYFRATQGKLGLLVKRGDKFTEESEAAAMEGLAGDLVRDWRRLAEGRPTVGFFPRRSHAQDAMALLSQAGLRVEYVDGDTSDDDRIRIFRDLNEHRIDYLCNVQVVERGTDIPAISCVQMCVAVCSIVRWRQMIGRGSRTHSGKTDCIVLDHGGSLKRGMGLFEDDIQWSLDITTKDTDEVGVRPTIECPECNAIYRGGRCRNCGHVPPRKELASQGLDFDGSELVEVKKGKETKSNAKTAEALMISCLYSAGKSGRTWSQCCGMFRGKCIAQGTPGMRVPKSVEVGGVRYEMLRYGSLDSSRRVAALYPFTAGRGLHGGEYRKESAGLFTE